jgi:ABC-type transport system involved in multi-copper enzyme maturation permease subunit
MHRGPILTIAAFSFLEAVRNRLSWLILLLILAAFVSAEFAGGLAITDSAGIKSAVAGSFLRLGTVLLLSLFVITSQAREFQDKVIELSLALAVPRAAYVVGKLLGYTGLGTCCALLCGLAVLVYAPAAQAGLWTASLVAEVAIVVAASLLCSITFNQVTGAFIAVFAFYLLARCTAAIQLIAHGPILDHTALSHQVMTFMIDAIAFLLPDLYRFTPSDWLIYHTAEVPALGMIAAQTAIYVTLLSGAALFDFYRKNL